MPSATIFRGMRFRLLALLSAAFSLCLMLSCNGNRVEICRSGIGKVWLYDGGDTTARLLHVSFDGDTLSVWPLYHPVYHYDYGDLNCDGRDEIVVGVTKKTRYWREEARRLFVFKLYEGELIRPLWLGSRLGCPIETFRVERDSSPARIVSTEKCSDSVVHVMYRIKGFGPKFESYVKE